MNIMMNNELDIPSKIKIYPTIEQGAQLLINMPINTLKLVRDVYDLEIKDEFLMQISLIDYISLVFGGIKLKAITQKIMPSTILELSKNSN